MMITRCPECATAFRITSEQIQVRQGRVRCGHCGEIFDAMATMESDEESDFPQRDDDRPASDEAQAASTNASEGGESSGPRQEETEPASYIEETADERPPDPAPSRPSSIIPEQAAPAEDFSSATSFVEEKSFDRWWTAAAVLLFLVLTVQMLFYFRGAIALVWPATKPQIQRVCARLGCEVPLPRRAELMSIETSDLQAEPANPGVMVLSATLRNRAAFPQAYPALELTLTNDRDEPLARKVLQPADYLERGPRERRAEDGLASCAGGVPSCEIQVKLLFDAASIKASGYRLYLFYPS